jgi:hypothetical protein
MPDYKTGVSQDGFDEVFNEEEERRPEEDEGHFHHCRGCRDAVQCWCDHPDDDEGVYCAECEE